MKNLFLLLIAAGIAPVLCAPALAQPDTNGARFTQLVNDLPYPLVTPEEAVKRIAGKPIALKLRDVTLVQALQELQKQSGAKIDTAWNANSAEMKKKLSLDLETTSFNRALHEILDEAGVKARLQQLGGLWRLEVGSSDDNRNARQSGLDPLSIRLIKVNNTLSKTVDLSEPDQPQNSDDNALTLFFDTPPDPLLELAPPRLRITRAEDEQGRALTLDKMEDRQRFMAPGVNPYLFRQPLTIRLSQPAADARKLAHLEGVAIYVVPSAREFWEVPDALNAKDVEHEFISNDQTFRAVLQSVTQQGDGVEVKLKITAAPEADLVRLGDPRIPPPLLSLRNVPSAMSLEDANGNILRPSSSNINESSSDGITLVTAQFRQYTVPTRVVFRDGTVVRGNDGTAMRFRIASKNPLAPPFKFIFDAPKDFVQTEVPFSFSDVPLP